MVGVSGRSIACHTCKQRRIRCGGEKPACNNCIKSKRACAGYQRNHAFILSSYTPDSAPNSSTNQANFDSDPIPVLSSRWKISAPEEASVTRSNQRNMRIRKSSQSSSHLLQSISSRHTYRNQLLALFINEQCPPDIISHTFPTPHRKWLFQLASLPSVHHALEDAILAVCTSKLGRKQGFGPLRHNSLALYIRALLKLQRAIDNPASRYDEETAAACLALGMYEFAECPGRTTDAYIRHFNGVMEIIRARGPEAHAKGLAHGLFQVLRTHAGFHGLHRRQATFLSQPEWLSLPWSMSSKEPYDLLLDIFLEMPDIIHSIDIFKSVQGSNQELSRGWSTVSKCLYIEEELKTWLSDYSDTVTGPLYWPELSMANSITDTEKTGKLFPVMFSFPSFSVGEAMVLYWTVRVLLHSHLSLVYRRLLAIQEDLCHNQESESYNKKVHNDAISQLQNQEELLEASARWICQSVQYFCAEPFREIGSSTILPSMVVLRTIFRRTPGDWTRGEAWVGEKLSQIQDMGNNFVGYI